MNTPMNTKYDPKVHHRHSMRLYGYDYSCDGLYFITLCCQQWMCLFGEIIDNEMVLNEAGHVAEEEWQNTINIRPGQVLLHEYVIMPNHMHAIVEITQSTSLSTLRSIYNNWHAGFPEVVDDNPIPCRSPSHTLGAIVRGYKAAVSKRLGFTVWQRNYYEHIIRNSQSYQRISEYIIINPENWQGDDLYIDE